MNLNQDCRRSVSRGFLATLLKKNKITELTEEPSGKWTEGHDREITFSKTFLVEAIVCCSHFLPCISQ